MFRGSSKSAFTGSGFYWEDSSQHAPGTKDWITNNKKSIKSTSSISKTRLNGHSQSQSSAKFIPGLTTNPKYAHVQSKVGDIIKKVSSKESSSEAPNPILKSKSSISIKNANAAPMRPVWGASAAANANYLRQAKSTTDLRNCEDDKVKMQNPAPKPRLWRQQPPAPESVYNWRFNDIDEIGPRGYDPSQPERFSNDNPHLHRIEYLPCDGICRDEVNRCEDSGLAVSLSSGSGRPVSMSSRGVNTDETRIYKQIWQQEQESYHREVRPQDGYHHNQSNGMSNTTQTQTTEADGYGPAAIPVQIKKSFPYRKEMGQGDDGHQFHKKMENLNIINGRDNDKGNQQRLSASTATTSTLQSQVLQANLPHGHKLGVVPKYLKTRQLELQSEAEAKAKSLQNSDVPPGHVLMSESERAETMNGLKQNYQLLINELNRIPISMDTIRIRERRNYIEKQLEKIEQAMKVFSRDRVFVKVDVE